MCIYIYIYIYTYMFAHLCVGGDGVLPRGLRKRHRPPKGHSKTSTGEGTYKRPYKALIKTHNIYIYIYTHLSIYLSAVMEYCLAALLFAVARGCCLRRAGAWHGNA